MSLCMAQALVYVPHCLFVCACVLTGCISPARVSGCCIYLCPTCAQTETRIKELTDTFGLSLETAKQVVAQVNEQIPTDYDPGDHVFFEGMDKDHTGSYYLAMGS